MRASKSGFSTRDRRQRQHGVHRTGTITFAIECDVFKPKTFEYLGETRCHLRRKGTVEIFTRDLNAHQIAMMSDAALWKAEGVQRFLTLLHLREGFARDSASVLDARRETRGSRLVP